MSVTETDGRVPTRTVCRLPGRPRTTAGRSGRSRSPRRTSRSGLVGRGGTDPLVKPGQMRVETYRASTGRSDHQLTIDQGVATAVSGPDFTFDREIQFTGLSVSRDPGTILVWIGPILPTAGFTIGFMLPHKRIWGRSYCSPNGVGTPFVATLPGRVTHDVDRAFTDLVSISRRQCAAPTAT